MTLNETPYLSDWTIDDPQNPQARLQRGLNEFLANPNPADMAVYALRWHRRISLYKDDIGMLPGILGIPLPSYSLQESLLAAAD